jgi:hypothetical protein
MTAVDIDSWDTYIAAIRALDTMDPNMRDQFAGFIATEANRKSTRYPLAPANLAQAQQLKHDGIVDLGRILNAAQCQRMVADAKAKPTYAQHVAAYSDGIARTVEETKRLSPYASYKLGDALEIPELFQIADHPQILGLIDDYLGCQPTIYSVHLFWTFANLPEPAHTHKWHRDIDDFRFLSLFIYLTDVGPRGGPFQFVKRTHSLGLTEAALAQANAQRAQAGQEPVAALDLFPPVVSSGEENNIPVADLFASDIANFEGPAGTAFLADTYGLHRGTVPFDQDRLVCWIRFGLIRNVSYFRDKTEPCPVSRLPYLPQNVPIPRHLRLILDGYVPS